MGTKLPSTLLTKYHKLNKIHSRVLRLTLRINSEQAVVYLKNVLESFIKKILSRVP